MDLIRKIKFRQTGDDSVSRDDLIAPVTALFVALSMEKAKITDFDIAGVPAATNLGEDSIHNCVHVSVFVCHMLWLDAHMHSHATCT